MTFQRMQNPELRCAVVGLGRIASRLEADTLREKPCTHAGAIAAHPETVLVGGVDISSKARTDFKKRWNLPYVYPRLETLLAERAVDILHIAADTKTHVNLLRGASVYGVPVIVLEKPVATTLEEAYAFVNHYQRIKAPRGTATQNERVSTQRAKLSRPTRLEHIVINHERRFAKDYRFVKALLANKDYGELVSITGVLFSKAPQNTLDLLLHDGTHLVDALFYFLELDYVSSFKARLARFKRTGKLDFPCKTPKQAYFHASRNKVRLKSGKLAYAETLTCQFTYSQARTRNIPVTLELGSGREYFHFEITLHCTRGRIRIGNGLLNIEATQPSLYYENFYSLYKTGHRPFRRTKPFINMLEEAVKIFKGEQLVSSSSYLSGLMPLLLKAEIERALSRNR